MMNLLHLAKSKGKQCVSWFFTLALYKKVLILGVLIFGVFLLSRLFGQKGEQPQYQTAKVERGTLVSSVSASGNISSGNSVSVTTSATGVVSSVYVHNGDAVSLGQKIADITLDTASQQKQTAAWASYLSAQNALTAAKSKMNALQSALFKANQTFVKGAGTEDPITDDPTYIIQKADWQQAEADYKNQAGVIAQTEAALSSAWFTYQQTSASITVPIAGNIANLTLTPGLPIQSQSSATDNSTGNASQAVGTVAINGGQLQASVNLSEIDVTKVKEGQKVTLTLDAFPGKTFTGKVASIDTNGSISSGVTTYPATITIDSAVSTIYPNMAVSARIITLVKDDVLLVPSGAIQSANGETSARVLRNKQVQQVAVEIGESSDTQTEILSGLSVGDEVITSVVTQTTTGTSGNSPFGGQGGFGVFRAGGSGSVGTQIRRQQ